MVRIEGKMDEAIVRSVLEDLLTACKRPEKWSGSSPSNRTIIPKANSELHK